MGCCIGEHTFTVNEEIGIAGVDADLEGAHEATDGEFVTDELQDTEGDATARQCCLQQHIGILEYRSRQRPTGLDTSGLEPLLPAARVAVMKQVGSLPVQLRQGSSCPASGRKPPA